MHLSVIRLFVYLKVLIFDSSNVFDCLFFFFADESLFDANSAYVLSQGEKVNEKDVSTEIKRGEDYIEKSVQLKNPPGIFK